jgi:hypothetical protein
MKVSTAAAVAGVVLGLAAPALAQEAAPASPASPAPAAPAAAADAAPSDADIAKFAKVMMGFQELQKQGKGSDQEAMAAVLKEVGLSIETYNGITNNMRTDTALNDRVTAAYRSAVMASQAPTAATPAQN